MRQPAFVVYETTVILLFQDTYTPHIHAQRFDVSLSTLEDDTKLLPVFSSPALDVLWPSLGSFSSSTRFQERGSDPALPQMTSQLASSPHLMAL
jgi:hypothetical protein